MSPWTHIILSGLLIGGAAIWQGYGWVKFQERFPVIDAECRVSVTGNPCSLECTVHNSGRGESRDVFISFSKMLPLGTKVLSAPETGIELIESDILPNPIVDPASGLFLTAFSVRVPRIAPEDSVNFQVITTHPDNQRAGKEVTQIHDEIVDIMKDFHERLSQTHPEDTTRIDIEAATRHLSKLENFFTPAKLSYEKGRQLPVFHTDEEAIAWAEIREQWHRHDAERKDVLKGRHTVKVPEVRIKIAGGEGYYGIFPPFVGSFHQRKISEKEFKQIKEKGLESLFIETPPKK